MTLKCEIWESSILRHFLLATVKKDAVIIPQPRLALFKSLLSEGNSSKHGASFGGTAKVAVRYFLKKVPVVW